MDWKETRDIIECALSEVEWDYPLDYAEAFAKALNAIDYQIELEERNA